MSSRMSISTLPSTSSALRASESQSWIDSFSSLVISSVVTSKKKVSSHTYMRPVKKSTIENYEYTYRIQIRNHNARTKAMKMCFKSVDGNLTHLYSGFPNLCQAATTYGSLLPFESADANSVAWCIVTISTPTAAVSFFVPSPSNSCARFIVMLCGAVYI